MENRGSHPAARGKGLKGKRSDEMRWGASDWRGIRPRKGRRVGEIFVFLVLSRLGTEWDSNTCVDMLRDGPEAVASAEILTHFERCCLGCATDAAPYATLPSSRLHSSPSQRNRTRLNQVVCWLIF